MKRVRSDAGKKHNAHQRRAPTVTCFRSALTNGSSLFLDKSIDQRSAFMRRLRDLITDHVSDLGGVDVISSAETALVRRCAMLTLQLELLEQQFANNENGAASAKSLDTYQRTVGALRRTLEFLGLRRRTRDVTPNLQEYLGSKEAAE